MTAASLKLARPRQFGFLCAMKKLISRTILGLVFAGLCTAPAFAQTRIATVDLKKVFEGYWRTKQADAAIKERAADLDKELKGLREDYDKAKTEYQKLLSDANDQAVSTEERDKRKKAAEAKLKSIRETEDTVVTFQRNATSSLQELNRRMREEVLKKIREAVNVKSKSGGFSLVVDTAAETVNNTPVVLFSTSENDITETVLKQLNSDAPSETARPAAKEEKK
jgi:outer membrane protein